MKIAFFGDGTLDMNKRLRDGQIIWRRETLRSLQEQGHEAYYLAPKHRSREAEQGYQDLVLGWDWRGEVDALIFESRRPFFPPTKGKEQTHVYYAQGRLIRDWYDGKLGDPAIFAQDVDRATDGAFGLGNRTSEYECVRWCRELMPWMPDALERFRSEVTVLVPFDPKGSPLEGERCKTFSWGYPESVERDLMPMTGRRWDLFYPGSDYGRRDKIDAYYAEAAANGYQVGVGGSWRDEAKGTHDVAAYKGGEFKAQALQRGAGNLTFVENGRNLSQAALMAELAATRAVVQITRRDYREIGYETNRPGEVTAAGALCFVDSSIRSPGGDVPDEWFRVSSFKELHEKLESVRGREQAGVELWRSFLRQRGTVADQARYLVRLIKERERMAVA